MTEEQLTAENAAHVTADPAEAVTVTYVHRDDVAYSFHQSMVALLDHDMSSKARVWGGGYTTVRGGTDGLAHARNTAVKTYLEDRRADWLWWVDTDMGFAPDTVDRLLEAADSVERPVMGALCFANYEFDNDGMGGHRAVAAPVIMHWAQGKDELGFDIRWDYPKDAVVRCDGVGSACVLIHYSVLERVRKKYGEHWYSRVRNPSTGELVAEDLSFCARLMALEIPVHVHTGVKTTHAKRIWLAEEDYWAQRALNAPPLSKPTGPSSAPSPLPVHIDIDASLRTLEANEHVHDGMLKLPADLDRYRQIIEATKPEVIVETGTHTGSSARWFFQHGVDVVTVDRERVDPGPDRPCPTFVTGGSADAAIAANVAELVAGRRCMVSLDSDHSAVHVAKEIELYGPLVSPGCYLVVEDGIFGYASQELRAAHGLGDMVGSPLDAIEKHLAANPDWSRDVAIERTHPISHHPAGWWVRNERWTVGQ